MTRPSDISPELYERADLLRDQFRHIGDDLEYTARVIMAIECQAEAIPLGAGLTENMARAARFIAGFIERNGHSPSYREIAEAVGLASKSGVVRLVDELEQRGVVERQAGLPRSLRIVARA